LRVTISSSKDGPEFVVYENGRLVRYRLDSIGLRREVKTLQGTVEVGYLQLKDRFRPNNEKSVLMRLVRLLKVALHRRA
jgi:hypothetical protein